MVAEAVVLAEGREVVDVLLERDENQRTMIMKNINHHLHEADLDEGGGEVGTTIVSLVGVGVGVGVGATNVRWGGEEIQTTMEDVAVMSMVQDLQEISTAV